MMRPVAPLALVGLVVFSVPAAAAGIDDMLSVEVLRGQGIYRAAQTAAPVVTLLTAVAKFTRPPILAPMYVGLVALQAYDLYSTHRALKQGAEERNPLLIGAMAHPAVAIAVRVAVTTFVVYTAEKLWKRKQRVAAIVLMGATNSLMAVVAGSNASVLRGQR